MRFDAHEPSRILTAGTADVTASRRDTGYCPSTPVEAGVGRHVDGYRNFHGARDTPAADAVAMAAPPANPRC